MSSHKIAVPAEYLYRQYLMRYATQKPDNLVMIAVEAARFAGDGFCPDANRHSNAYYSHMIWLERGIYYIRKRFLLQNKVFSGELNWLRNEYEKEVTRLEMMMKYV